MTRLKRRAEAREGDEAGFTLVELMVVFVIIAVLMMVAFPTFAEARTLSQDRAARARLRHALLAEHLQFTYDLAFTEDPAVLGDIEKSNEYLAGDTPLVGSTVYLHVHPLVNNGELFISTRSESGRCYYVRERPGLDIGYAVTGGPCGVADTQAYTATWDD